MRKLLAFVAITAVAIANARAEEVEPVQPVTWLFIQNASSMQFDGATLTLTGLTPTVTAFSDRPHRLVVPLHTGDYLALWQAGEADFTDDPPNAGLTVLVDGLMQTAVVELTNPMLDGDTLRYQVTVIDGSLPLTGTVASLLVDAFPTAVNSQITDAVTQANTKVLGDAPAIAMGNLFQATSQALSSAAHNDTDAQHESAETMDATTAQGVSTLMSLDADSSVVP